MVGYDIITRTGQGNPRDENRTTDSADKVARAVRDALTASPGWEPYGDLVVTYGPNGLITTAQAMAKFVEVPAEVQDED